MIAVNILAYTHEHWNSDSHEAHTRVIRAFNHHDVGVGAYVSKQSRQKSFLHGVYTLLREGAGRQEVKQVNDTCSVLGSGKC